MLITQSWKSSFAWWDPREASLLILRANNHCKLRSIIILGIGWKDSVRRLLGTEARRRHCWLQCCHYRKISSTFCSSLLRNQHKKLNLPRGGRVGIYGPSWDSIGVFVVDEQIIESGPTSYPRNGVMLEGELAISSGCGSGISKDLSVSLLI